METAAESFIQTFSQAPVSLLLWVSSLTRAVLASTWKLCCRAVICWCGDVGVKLGENAFPPSCALVLSACSISPLQGYGFSPRLLFSPLWLAVQNPADGRETSYSPLPAAFRPELSSVTPTHCSLMEDILLPPWLCRDIYTIYGTYVHTHIHGAKISVLNVGTVLTSPGLQSPA